MEILYILVLFAGGVFSGIYAATVGSGSLVSFPLLLLTGLPIHVAVATNRFAATLLGIAASTRYYIAKKIDLKKGGLLGILAAVGAVIGSKLLMATDEKALTIITAVLLLAVFLIVIFKNKLGLEERKISEKKWVVTGIFTFLLGIYGGFFGAGFGTFMTFILVLAGLNFLQSAAMTRLIGVIMSFTATVIFALNGLIDYKYGLSLGIGFAIGAWIGAGIGIKKGNKYIKSLFVLLLFITTIKLVFDFQK